MSRIDAPHPLLGVPVTYEIAHGGWTSGYVADVHGVNVTVCERTGTCRYTYLLSDEGRTWRRAGVEYPEAAPKEPEAKSLGQVLWEAESPSLVPWRTLDESERAYQERLAQAVVAAYEAGKPKVEYETVARYALFDPEDNSWWNGGFFGKKSGRILMSKDVVESAKSEWPVRMRIVKVTTRRRVKVQP